METEGPDKEKHIRIAESIDRLEKSERALVSFILRTRGEVETEVDEQPCAVTSLGEFLNTASDRIDVISAQIKSGVDELEKILFG